jgi:cobalamin biosynthesis protein CbiG
MPEYVLGVGASSKADADELAALVAEVLTEAEVDSAAVTLVATVDTRRDHPAVQALDWPTRGYPAADLTAVTPSVAEAAALLAAGEGATLVVGKRRSAHATAAIARSTP